MKHKAISKPNSAVAAFARTQVFPVSDRTLASAATMLKLLHIILTASLEVPASIPARGLAHRITLTCKS